jgi:large subunit ribosomal protein L22
MTSHNQPKKEYNMQVRSTYRFARISAFKAREVTREIQGLPASDALDLLRFVPKKAAGLVRKTLASAIANAENNNNLNVSNLVVQEAIVGEGPTSKRFQPKARGSAGPIRKRTSHIRIILTDEIEIKRREKRGAKKSKKAGSKAAASKPAKKITKDQPAPQAAPSQSATAAPEGESKE